MKSKAKFLTLCCLWLMVSALAIFTFAGALGTQTSSANTGKRTLPQHFSPVALNPGDEFELPFAVDHSGKGVNVSLSLDSGNRHIVTDKLALPGNLENLTIDKERKLAFLANSFSGVQIVDISDVNNLRLVGAIAAPGNAWDLKLQGETLFVAAAGGGLQIIDVSTPEEPSLISELRLPKTSLLKLIVHDRTVYATSGKKGMHVIDITNLTAPKLIRTLHTADGAWGITSGDNLLYLSCGQSHLEVFDLRTPNNPQLISSLSIPGNTWEMTLNDKYLYWPTIKSGLVTIEVKEPANPKIIHVAPVQTGIESIRIAQNRAYLTNRSGELVIFDLTRPAAPAQTHIIDLPCRTRNIGIDGPTLFLAGGLNGLVAIDTDTIPDRSPTRTLRLPGSLFRIFDAREYLYLATKRHGLFIARKQPANQLPKLVAELSVKGNIVGATRIDDHLFLASPDNGLQIIDISSPENPRISGRLNHTGNYHDVASEAHHLYALDQHGLLIANTTFPDNPIILGQLPLENAEKLIVAGNRAYVASSESGINIVDISDPTSPLLLGNATLPWPLKSLTQYYQLSISEKTLYLAAGIAELIRFDLTDEKNPKLAEIIPLEAEANAVFQHSNKVFVSTREGRIWIMQREGHVTTGLAVIDSIGSGYDMIFDENSVLLANGDKGLTFLPLPRQMEIIKTENTASRSGGPTRLKVRLPADSAPATYNLALFERGQLTEFVGAVTVTEAL